MGWTNSVSGYVEGHVIQAGVVFGDVHVLADRPVRSAYLEHVRALTPDRLEGREEELGTLATFCTSESTIGDYLWWRGPAWSGKSALLSWFVLHPPPGANLVSFFVTSRLPDQNNRHSFVDNVLDQLHDILGEPPRADLTATNREAYIRRLLTTVADRCRQRGEHFTVVVDGLDEDRGVDGSPDAHSIAALLPHAGVRVVVASRLLPDLPDDVPPDHPLRRSAVVEHLFPSPKAAAVRETMIRDLKRLLSGTAVHQDLLGFTTAAVGGLSVRDLAELAGTSEWQVQDDLRTTAGRSFTRRPGSPSVYVLAHDDLQGLAAEMLGPRLDTYRQRLHAWAETYRERKWPSDTPRYLLHGYTATLRAIGDVPRVLAYVTDPRWQDLVSASTGHDYAVLDEIKAIQELLLRQDEPDLAALARLAVHRTSLYLRNNWIPTFLPSVWVRVGRLDRAETLIAAIGNLVKRCRALTSVATQLHREGNPRRAGRMLDEAEDLAGYFNQWWGAWPHAELAAAAMQIGDDERTRRAVNAIMGRTERAKAYASLAHVALDNQRHDDAAKWYLEAEGTLNEAGAYVDLTASATVAAAAARLGHSSKAAALVDQILDHAVAGTDSDSRKAEAARTLAGGGLTDAACAVSATIGEEDRREDNLLHVTSAVADLNLDEAEELARSASDVRYLSARLAAVAVAAGRNGDQSRADRLLAEIDQTLADLPRDNWRRFTIMATAVAWADAGAIERAESIVHSDMVPSRHADGVLSIAVALARRSEVKRASRLVALAEEMARPASAGVVDEKSLMTWVGVMVDFGEFDRAEELVRSFPTDEVRSAGLATIAEGLLVHGSIDRAEEALYGITDPRRQRRPRMELLRVLIGQGEDERAVRVARSVATAEHRARALTFVAGMTRRPDLLDEVVDIAEDVTEPEARTTMLLPALQAAANLGDRPRTTALWRLIWVATTHTGQQSKEIGSPLRSFFHHGLPHRQRTLTEIADFVDSQPRSSRSEEPPTISVGAPPFWQAGKGLPKHVELAHDLATRDWFDLVDKLVDFEPSAFQAIVLELDRLGSRASFHPLNLR